MIERAVGVGAALGGDAGPIHAHQTFGAGIVVVRRFAKERVEIADEAVRTTVLFVAGEGGDDAHAGPGVAIGVGRAIGVALAASPAIFGRLVLAGRAGDQRQQAEPRPKPAAGEGERQAGDPPSARRRCVMRHVS
ncbi:MAG: hypothetical protein C4523_16275 [Myxococcales bacterium]|nr:MAG: hypothetical protein C4523_16275 [Myxococcales bacterium]